MVEADPSRYTTHPDHDDILPIERMFYSIAVGFYSLGSLDIIQMLDKRTKEADRNLWREWIWAQQVERRASSSNEYVHIRFSTFFAKPTSEEQMPRWKLLVDSDRDLSWTPRARQAMK